MDCTFGCARPLYASKTHPRLFVGPDDLVALREKCRRGAGKRLMDAIRRRVAPLVTATLEADDLVGLLADYNRGPDHMGPAIYGGLHEIALTAAINGDSDAFEATRRALIAAPDADPRARQDHFCRNVSYVADVYCNAYDLVAPDLSARDRRTFTRWIVRTAIPHLTNAIPPSTYYRNAGSNISLGAMTTGVTAALAVMGDPGVPSLRKTLDRLIGYLQASLRCAIGPDGYPVEDIGYGTAVTGYLAVVCDQLRRAGLYDVYAECPRFARYGRAIIHFVQPWGHYLSNTGDFKDHFGNREYPLTRLATETNDPSLLWLVGTLAHQSEFGNPPEKDDFGAEVELRAGLHVPPNATNVLLLDEYKRPVRPTPRSVPTAFRDRGRGIVSFRSGWDDMDSLLIFDGSQRSIACPGHDHASAGNFTLSAMGEYFAIDCGRYCNEQQEHNVVLLNGKSGYSHEGEWKMTPHAGILLDYAPDPFCDFAAADASLQTQCYLSRRYIGLVKGDTGRGGPTGYAWTVEEVNHLNRHADLWWTLNTHPGNQIELCGDHAVVHGCQVGSALDVRILLLPEDQYSEPYKLKFCKDTNTCRATGYVGNPRTNADQYAKLGVHGSVMVRPRLIGRVNGMNGRFMSLMIPRAANGQPAKVEQLPTLYNAIAVKITFADVQDILIWAYDHGMLEAADIVARGQWCAVRRSRTTGKIIRYAVGHGTRLEIGGRPCKLGYFRV